MEGTRALTVPRGRVGRAGDRHEEFHSTVVPRYAHRTREVDEALLGCYFGGVNSRRIRRALKPLFGEWSSQDFVETFFPANLVSRFELVRARAA